MCKLTKDKLQRLHKYIEDQSTTLFKGYKDGYLQAILDIAELM